MGDSDSHLARVLEAELKYRILERCRICGVTELADVYQMPPQYLSPRFVTSNEGLETIKVPLTLALCASCGHLQLREEVEPDLLYRQYFYRSATSDTMRAHLGDVVSDVQGRVDLAPGDIVLDVGANDATLLSYFPAGVRKIGVEPAQNIDWSSVAADVEIVNDYFSSAELPSEKVRVVTCCAMFYDVSAPHDFVRRVKSSLADDGLWCIQVSYLPLMLENLNFYDICHEHLSYHTLDSLERLLSASGLSAFDSTTNPVNGGSIRLLACHREFAGYSTAQGQRRLERLRQREQSMNLKSPSTFVQFGEVIDRLGWKVRGYIQQCQVRGELVLGLGASTKGNVLLQHFGLEDMIPYISERNSDKVGLRTLGTDIELISEQSARSMNPSCMLVLPWYYKDEIVTREANYLENGGTLLFPMPVPHVVTGQGEFEL